MSEVASNSVEEEFLWSCSLTGSNKEYVWEPATLEPEQENKEEGDGEGGSGGGVVGIFAGKLWWVDKGPIGR